MQVGGLPVYSMQQGGGLFSLLRFVVPAVKSAVRLAAPVAKRVAKQTVRDLATAGVSTGLEMLEGHDPATSAKRNLKRAAQNTLETALAGPLLNSSRKRRRAGPKKKKRTVNQRFAF